MQFSITLAGDESAELVARIHAAIDTLYNGGAVLSAGVTMHGTTPPPACTVEATAMAAGIDPAAVGFGIGTPAPPTVTQDGYTFDPSKIATDAAGLPWDGRIHASTKTQTQDKHWKKKKGVDDATVERVSAELRNIMTIPVPAAPSLVAVLPSLSPPVAAAAPVVPAPPAPVVAEVPAPPAPAAAVPPPPAAVEPMSFVKLMGWLGQHMTPGGKLPPAVISERMASIGIVDGAGNGQLALLATRPDLVPAAYEALNAVVSGA